MTEYNLGHVVGEKGPKGYTGPQGPQGRGENVRKRKKPKIKRLI